MKPGCWKNIAGGAVLLAVVATAVGTSAAPAEQDFASPATLRKGVGIVLNTTLKIGKVLAPDTGSLFGIFRIDEFSGDCLHLTGGGACLADATRNRGSLSFTGEPNFTVFVTSSIPDPGSPGIIDDPDAVDCTGGTGTTPVRVTSIRFSAVSSLLDVTGDSTTPVFVGAWFVVWDTSLGTQTCAYDIIADY